MISHQVQYTVDQLNNTLHIGIGVRPIKSALTQFRACTYEAGYHFTEICP